MAPQLTPRSYVLTRKIFSPHKLRPGQVVVFENQKYGLMVKKVALNAPSSNQLEFMGVHVDSIKQRDIGRIDYDCLRGLVLFQVKAT